MTEITNNLPAKPCPFCGEDLPTNGICANPDCSGKKTYDNGFVNDMPIEEYE